MVVIFCLGRDEALLIQGGKFAQTILKLRPSIDSRCFKKRERVSIAWRWLGRRLRPFRLLAKRAVGRSARLAYERAILHRDNDLLVVGRFYFGKIWMINLKQALASNTNALTSIARTM